MDTHVDEEYEIQYFGFSSTYFIQELSMTVCDLVKNIMKTMKSCIPSDLPEEDRNVYCNKIDVLLLESEKSMKLTIHNLKADICAFFAIPKNVTLKTDNKANSQATKSTVQNLEDEVTQLEKRYIKAKTFIYLCEKEIEILKLLEPIQEKITGTMEKLQAFTVPNKNSEIQKLNRVHEELINEMTNKINVHHCESLVSKGNPVN